MDSVGQTIRSLLYPYTAERRDVLGNTSPEAREISRGRSPREISRAEGCKIPARGKSQGPRGMYFPMHPDSRQCTSILSALAGKYWFCGVFFIWNLKDLPHSASACTEWALHQPKLFCIFQYNMLCSVLLLKSVLEVGFNSALEISLGLRPREISRASGCKIHALGKSLGPRGMYFPIHPSSRQCTDTVYTSSKRTVGETYFLLLFFWFQGRTDKHK